MTDIYKPVAIYDLDSGEFFAYAIRTQNKLQSVNVWTENEVEDLKERLSELQSKGQLQAVWPHPQDPEVVALLAREDFYPIEKHFEPAIDEEKSKLVYDIVDVLDSEGNPTGRTRTGFINEEKSLLVYKMVEKPKKPTEVKMRLQAAMQAVAEARLKRLTAN